MKVAFNQIFYLAPDQTVPFVLIGVAVLLVDFLILAVVYTALKKILKFRRVYMDEQESEMKGR